ncbi:MAG: tRNA (5-methylaminomethyl-2-thiouridine)(34)-methyltransferase MnmD [Roseovarius sp.]|nr:tRNA (5-methylaminomethyl-2-thiouridine)(34)-methyltransferase MnmD [Roseovarius sp.]MCY4206413.1 tRNA (5-methylaminomethyl-2-thiouridine)(34)-methyltransferase MnmD [Roseovarius sp.]MCY4292252.1 tRNA (5-methylaminomethyl-2-thiouridine)(34)-methyltransferase MnmD [Roseovarius sp.]MCY4316295.1 tRNA (5-methylaminomethyl-2-thiouridine)(34)-methyltransferase MnmD [Roseovarius sp.]
MQNPKAEIEWRDGNVPISIKFDDPYYSLENGLAEARHVFIGGNHLPGRFRDGFHVAELGFGTGLNLLAILDSWRRNNAKGKLKFTSFEAFPMAVSDMIRSQAAFPELDAVASALASHWKQGARRIILDDLDFTLIIGDARQTLPNWCGMADAWLLDGFSPAKNPELWEESLLAQVFAKTRPSGTAASYTAAGFVRRRLESSGFSVFRIPGHGRKRHMTRAIKAFR